MMEIIKLLFNRIPERWEPLPLLILLIWALIGPCLGFFVAGFFGEMGRGTAISVTEQIYATPTAGPLNEQLTHFLDEALLALEKAYQTGNPEGLENYFCDEALEKIKARVIEIEATGLSRQLQDFGHREFDFSNPLTPKITVDDEGWTLNGKGRPYSTLYAFRRNAQGRWCIYWTVEEHFVPWQGSPQQPTLE